MLYVVALLAVLPSLIGCGDEAAGGGPSAAASVSWDAPTYEGAGAVARIQLIDPDLVGPQTVNVLVTSEKTDPTGETVALAATEFAGVFSGTVGFERPFDSVQETPIVPGNGKVGVYAEGGRAYETITVSYEDPTNTGGADPVTAATRYQEPSSTLTSVVKDRNTNSGVVGALVTIEQTEAQAVTRGGQYAGQFALYDVPSGQYMLVITYDGVEIERLDDVRVP